MALTIAFSVIPDSQLKRLSRLKSRMLTSFLFIMPPLCADKKLVIDHWLHRNVIIDTDTGHWTTLSWTEGA